MAGFEFDDLSVINVPRQPPLGPRDEPLLYVEANGTVRFGPHVSLWSDGRVFRISRLPWSAEIPVDPNPAMWAALFAAAKRQGLPVHGAAEDRAAYGYELEHYDPPFKARSFNTRFVSHHETWTPDRLGPGQYLRHRDGLIPASLHTFPLILERTP